jgi:glycosyltransferase involved in cell wall biosynthesis
VSAREPTARPEAPKRLRASVVIPCRNRAALTVELVEALFAQTLPPSDFEIVVVDNRSTDDTAQRIAALQERSPYRLLFHVMPENRGPAHSRNAGVGLARGEIIAFTDSDCRPRRDWLERGLVCFAAPDVAFVTGSVFDKPEQRGGFFARATGALTVEHPSYPTMNAFYRRRFFVEAGGFDESLCFRDFRDRPNECADTDLAWRLKEKGLRNVFDPELVIFHEVENQPALAWVLEPFRLWLVPALVRRHPQLRRSLLRARFFFCKENALICLAVLGVLAGIALDRSLFLFVLPYGIALPYLWWAIALRKRPVRLRDLWRFLPQTALIAARQLVMCAGLAYGSLRFRCLVL